MRPVFDIIFDIFINDQREYNTPTLSNDTGLVNVAEQRTRQRNPERIKCG